MFGIDPSELTFYLNEEASNKSNEKSRYLIRRRYWDYSLPQIREKSGIFTNVNSSKDNWISGFIGINGVYVTCVANFDSSRVELELNMSQKEKNKELFDYLYSYKSIIEKNIEKNFIWERKDDTKVSKIYLKISDEIGRAHV